MAQEKRLLIFKVRIIQLIFFAIFAFGISWIISDLAEFLKLPINSMAIGTTIFGIFGMLGCEILIKWIEKHFLS